jgi:hypothetical protein
VIEVDDRPGPNSALQLLPGYQLARLLQQRGEDLKGQALQPDARPALGQFAGAKIDFEDAKAQTPGRVIGLHGKLGRACRTAASLRPPSAPRKRRMFIDKPLIFLIFPGDRRSRNKTSRVP